MRAADRDDEEQAEPHCGGNQATDAAGTRRIHVKVPYLRGLSGWRPRVVLFLSYVSPLPLLCPFFRAVRIIEEEGRTDCGFLVKKSVSRVLVRAREVRLECCRLLEMFRFLQGGRDEEHAGVQAKDRSLSRLC